MGEMMTANTFFGMSAFGLGHDVCEILETIAPNVSELQLFRDDVPGVCISRECRIFIFPVVSILSHHPFRRKCFAFSNFHIFTLRYLPLRLSPIHSSLPYVS
jgi:hypothetical protein